MSNSGGSAKRLCPLMRGECSSSCVLFLESQGGCMIKRWLYDQIHRLTVGER